MELQLPMTLKMGNLMSEEKFFQFCQMNDTLELERDSQGNVIVMSPTGTFTGGFNSKVLIELGIWNKENGLGEVFDSSTGFTLPNGAVRSPDVSWVRSERWESLSIEQKEKFAPLSPDFVVEIRSQSDDMRYLIDKMDEYIANGTQLAWLIDRFDKKVHIYKADRSITIHESIQVTLSGESVLPGFELDLAEILK
ncbi:Uma2 family endonuclease [Dyadobacter aurulentus]|uniref:Uma2 family endonuclease n=1 Tax=Dyadobacter sp. UC 10 TaxID=2605428 RepID=UPI0011F1DA95|nr:Uma2 family endonuclease [Dyadobacter sp. UC 10]KAA0991412.1 Uma2 family endonuclease [Dyadobacter sp. UC 10]